MPSALPCPCAKVSVTSVGGGWRVNHTGFDTAVYGNFSFAALPTQAGYKYLVQFYNTSGGAVGNAVDPSPYTHHDHGVGGQFWTVYSIPLTAFGAVGVVGGISIKDNSGAGTNVFYLSAIGFWGSPPLSSTIIYAPAVRMVVGNIGGRYNSTAAAISDWTTECGNVANKNSSRLIKGFELCVGLRNIFPAAQGDWGNSLGISLFQQASQMINGLPNGPYDISVSCNMVANTFGNTLISQNIAQGFVPPWWYDNTAFGSVGGSNHGGVYWDTTTDPSDGSNTGHMTARFWNGACMNEVLQVWSAIYDALEPQNIHLYRVEPTMEISGAWAMRQAGMTDAQIVGVLSGATGIPNGFAPGMRGNLPNSLLGLLLTYPIGQSDTPAILEAALSNKWSLVNFDGCNEQVPADLPSGSAKCSWGDLAFCGQTAVNGPVVSKNYKALGYDHHNKLVADELGDTRHTPPNPVPNATIGTGRIPDSLTHLTYMNSSHLYIQAVGFAAPPCNAMKSYTGQTANYKYPATGSVLPYANVIDTLNAFNVNSFLRQSRPF